MVYPDCERHLRIYDLLVVFIVGNSKNAVFNRGTSVMAQSPQGIMLFVSYSACV